GPGTRDPATASAPVPPMTPLKVVVPVLAMVTVLAPKSVTALLKASEFEPPIVALPPYMTTGVVIVIVFGLPAVPDMAAAIVPPEVPKLSGPVPSLKVLLLLLPTTKITDPDPSTMPPLKLLSDPCMKTGAVPANVKEPAAAPLSVIVLVGLK